MSIVVVDVAAGFGAVLGEPQAAASSSAMVPIFPACDVVQAGVAGCRVLAGRSGAQEWRTGAGIDLIRRAVDHRAARDADTLLAAWQAEAHGVLRYASVLDHGDGPVERVIRADELRVEVYGEAPNRSKQIIVAWRDTTFLPNRLNYHRDHLGIVANDFGATIRLGQGEEVRDVPHPLSDAGLDAYQFAIGDTVVLNGPRGMVRVVAIAVRPSHPDSMGTVGTLYLDLDRAALVRFRFTFTPASYRDPTVEEITVTLENALQQNARWLPWRQSIVIRRGFPLLEMPARTVIRGDWTIENYQLGVHHAADRFTGPYIAGPRVPNTGTWDTTLGSRARCTSRHRRRRCRCGARRVEGTRGPLAGRFAARAIPRIGHQRFPAGESCRRRDAGNRGSCRSGPGIARDRAYRHWTQRSPRCGHGFARRTNRNGALVDAR